MISGGGFPSSSFNTKVGARVQGAHTDTWLRQQDLNETVEVVDNHNLVSTM